MEEQWDEVQGADVVEVTQVDGHGAAEEDVPDVKVHRNDEGVLLEDERMDELEGVLDEVVRDLDVHHGMVGGDESMHFRVDKSSPFRAYNLLFASTCTVH